jgi:excisionase family DNA binding protein
MPTSLHVDGRTTQLVTIEQAAELLACTPAAIRKWLYQRRLTPVKIGRLTRLRLVDVEGIITSGLPESGRRRR